MTRLRHGFGGSGLSGQGFAGQVRRIALAALLSTLLSGAAMAQGSVANYCFNPNGSQAGNNQWVPCPSVSTLTGNGAGTTGAVVGTLTAAAGKTTYICGFSVDAIGGTGAVGPITIAGLLGSSMVFQLTASATGASRNVPFTPCVPASAANTAITVTTTADGSASAVNVNSWGFQQ